jgi:membrane protein DedA with SNARE-associated domain/membrane-associated phospholipid phosphatase
MQGLLSRLADLPSAAIYALAAVVVFAETATLVGLLLPAEITLFTAGYLSYTGTLNLPTSVAVLVVAAWAGDTAAYAHSRRTGPRLRSSRLGRWVGERRWTKADTLFTRYGGRAVGVGRFVAFARTLTPRLAGMSGLPYSRMLPWDVLGVLTAVGGSVLVGYLAGQSYATAANAFGQATKALLLLALVIVALVMVGRYLGRHRDPVAAFGERLVHTRPLRRLEHWYTAGFRWLSDRFGSGGALVANLALGIVALLGIGVALTWTIDQLVSQSGVPLIDPLIAQWMTSHRTPATAGAALTTLSVLRGPFLIVVVAAIGIALNPHPRSWRADLVGVVGTAGAFIPLLILAIASDWAGPSDVTGSFFPNQVTQSTAALGIIAWLLGRRLPWAVAVAIWTVAFGGVLLVGMARVYLQLNWLSQAVASTLLGALWVLVFVVAWHTRNRLSPTVPMPEPEQTPAGSQRPGG